MIDPTHLLYPFELIENAYSSSFSQATEEQKREIERSLAQYDLTGRVCIGGGAIGFIVSFFAWKIPYIGPVCGIIVGGASLASTIFGYDIFQCGKNLTIFVKDGEGKNKKFESIEKFRQSLIDQAVKSTLVFKGFLIKKAHSL